MSLNYLLVKSQEKRWIIILASIFTKEDIFYRYPLFFIIYLYIMKIILSEEQFRRIILNEQEDTTISNEFLIKWLGLVAPPILLYTRPV